MKKSSTSLILLILLLAFATAQAQVNVTFRLNTSSVRDTVGANSVAQIRGTTITAAGPIVDNGNLDRLSPTDSIDWNGKSSLILSRVGGDYWQRTVRLPAGTRMAYKFYVNSSHKTVAGGVEWEHNGWEDNVTATLPVGYEGNRLLDLSGFAGTDTTLTIQFYSGGWKANPLQYEKLYATNDTTNVVFVRVNVAGWDDFGPTRHSVRMRGSVLPDNGSVPASPQLDWGSSFELTQEGATKFYNAAIRVKKSPAATGLRYKYVIHNAGTPLNEDWSLMAYNPNAQYEFSIPARDTTIQWVFFNNLVPVTRANPDEVGITYRVDMTSSILNRGFAIGDTAVVRAGYFTTAREVYEVKLERQGFTNIYAATDTIFTAIGQEINYQYYLKKRGQEIRESYFDFGYAGAEASQAERRRIMIGGSKFQIDDVSSSKVESRRQPFFRNTQRLARSVRLTLKCDIRAAIFQVLKGDSLLDIQGNRHVRTVPDILNNGVWVNGPMTGGWTGWGATLSGDNNRKMYDDGTNGDATANDSIYTRILLFSPDSTVFSKNSVGQEFKFGIFGGDNESGFGLNHLENIDDSGPEYTFDIQFGSINPNKYNAWDFDNRKVRTAVAESPGSAPFTYSLAQNYPNPFNPETSIQYSLAKAGKVTLTIYNVMGQKVRTLVDESKPAGNYTVSWNGRTDRNTPVSTGVYFYKINAGDFNQIKKLLFLK